MNHVFVIDSNKKPLMPVHPGRARELLTKQKAAVYRQYPFTIILKMAYPNAATQPIEFKIDPGSRTTGLALVAKGNNGKKVVWGANLEHHGLKIKADLDSRRALRRGRRVRKLRYRKPRFMNRAKPKGWLPPSIKSRVDNVEAWAKKIIGLLPITSIGIEVVKFDMQRMRNAEISGVGYQQGTLAGYELRQYLLEKWGHKCAYCGAENVPLEIEHLHPKSKGGTNSITNLVIACHKCNEKKGTQDVREFLKRKPEVLRRVLAQVKAPLRDAAAVNATRYAIARRLKPFGLIMSFGSGGRTKMNRINQGYRKDHWIDAACVGITGAEVFIPTTFLEPLHIKAIGRGNRQVQQTDKYGFPKSKPRIHRMSHGFKTGDFILGEKHGERICGRVTVRRLGAISALMELIGRTAK